MRGGADFDSEAAFWRALGAETDEHRTAAAALWRPGPRETGLAAAYVERRHGHAAASAPHPLAAPALLSTYGLLLYREQVEEIVRALGGFPDTEATALRRVLQRPGHPDEGSCRRRFIAAALERGSATEAEAGELFEWLRQWTPHAIPRPAAEITAGFLLRQGFVSVSHR